MSILNKLKGFIKLSEVSSDSAHPLLDTAVREDINTVLNQSSLVLEDALRKQSIILTSTGNVTWSLNKLIPDANTDIIIKFLQNTNGQVVNLVLNYSDFVSGLSFLNDGDILYIELNRVNITGNTVNIYNSGVNIGQRAVISSSLPALVNNQSGSFQGTICIPIAVRQGVNLWWNPSGFYWPPGTSGVIGSIGTTDPTPTGSVFSFSGDLADVPSGYLLCDGSSKSAALYPALATIYWTGTNYLYGGSGFSPGSTPNGNFNLPDLRGLFVKGAGVHGTLINGKQYSATLAAKDSDRTGSNNIITADNGIHRHNHFTDVSGLSGGLGLAGSAERANAGNNYLVWSETPLPPWDPNYIPSAVQYLNEVGDHSHTFSSPDQQTHPAHVGLNYIIKA